MKIQLKRAIVRLPDGTTTEYSTVDMIEHIVRNGREFGRSLDANKLASGLRILEAVRTGGDRSNELSQEDGEAIRAAVAAPTCGWSDYRFQQDVTVGIDRQGVEVKRRVAKNISFSGIDVYPLIDGVLNG